MNEHKIIDITGQKFGYWTVIGLSDKIISKSRCWNCVCVCGKIEAVNGCRLRRGTSKSCRCRSQEFRLEKRMIHGETINRKSSKEYAAWQAMINRCYKPKSTNHYHNYGGRGITICESWKSSFESFLKDMGRAPSQQHSIDRIDNNGNYEPHNCRWATKIEQANNKRDTIYINHNGCIKSISELSRELHYGRSRICTLLKKGLFERVVK